LQISTIEEAQAVPRATRLHHCLTAFFVIGFGAGAFFGAAAAAAATFLLCNARVHFAF